MKNLVIDWQLKNNGEIVINSENQKVKCINEIIYYNDEYGNHEVDITKKIYRKKNNNENIEIDFENSLLTISFDDKKIKFDIETKYNINDNDIELIYFIGDDEKVIKITRKEGI